jgi:uncharacterized protein (TIGR02145 family)
MDKIEKLLELKSLLNSGIINQKEFDQMKGEIIGGVAKNASAKVEGTEIEEIKIHGQIWAKRNLDVSDFRNGDIVYQAKSEADWEAAGVQGRPAWCYHDNNPANRNKYGKLYNWFAVTDPRGLAPKGWHIPTDIEWTRMIDSIGGKDDAGIKLRSPNDWLYDGDRGIGTNSSGFNALPGGDAFGQADCHIGFFGGWWSSTELSSTHAWLWFLYAEYRHIARGGIQKERGYSIRCLRD